MNAGREPALRVEGRNYIHNYIVVLGRPSSGWTTSGGKRQARRPRKQPTAPGALAVMMHTG
jgi:hypothetical protein